MRNSIIPTNQVSGFARDVLELVDDFFVLHWSDWSEVSDTRDRRSRLPWLSVVVPVFEDSMMTETSLESSLVRFGGVGEGDEGLDRSPLLARV